MLAANVEEAVMGLVLEGEQPLKVVGCRWAIGKDLLYERNSLPVVLTS